MAGEWKYDRTGERVDLLVDDPDLTGHPHGCDQGWLEVPDHPGVFRHCPVCRALAVHERTTTTNRSG